MLVLVFLERIAVLKITTIKDGVDRGNSICVVFLLSDGEESILADCLPKH